MSKLVKSIIGEKMSQLTGVRAIMDDIKRVRASGQIIHADLSAGNPVVLPELVELWRRLGRQVLDSEHVGDILVRYGQSRGYEPLNEAIVKKFNSLYNLNLTIENVLITQSTQLAYFYLAAALAGPTSNGESLKITLPYCPDYTGYGGVALSKTYLEGIQSNIELIGDRSFRYTADFERLKKASRGGYMLLSRPSNPTGGVITQEEINFISQTALDLDKYLVIDNAYGAPFPNLTEVEIQPIFAEHIINCYSMSKTGLPGERIGIIIGNKEVIRLLESFQANAIIHPSRFGEAISALAIVSGELEKVCANVVAPYYSHKRKVLHEAAQSLMPKNIPWRFHKTDGALFAWLWLEGLNCTDWDFYNRLAAQGLLLVPGSPFFVGLEDENWKHSRECFRISLTAPTENIVKGIEILSSELKKI